MIHFTLGASGFGCNNYVQIIKISLWIITNSLLRGHSGFLYLSLKIAGRTGKTWQNMTTKGKRFIQYLGYERERLSSWQWMIIAIWNGIACWRERGGATIERSTMSHCLWPLPAKPLCVWKNPVPIICLYTTHSILLANAIFPVSWQSQMFCFVCLFVCSSPKWTTVWSFCLFCKF